MRTDLILSAFFIFISFSSFGQAPDSTWQQPKRNAVVVEVLSGPMWYSLNYQRTNFTHHMNRVAFTYKIGAYAVRFHQAVTGHAGVVLGKPSGSSLELLMGLGYLRANPQLYAKRNLTYTEGEPAPNNLFLYPQISYRRQRDKKGLIGKVSFLPWIIVSPFVSKVQLTPGVGVSIGKVF